MLHCAEEPDRLLKYASVTNTHSRTTSETYQVHHRRIFGKLHGTLTTSIVVFLEFLQFARTINKKASIRWRTARRQFQATGQPLSRMQA